MRPQLPPTQSSQYLVTPPPNAAPAAPTLSSQYLVTPPPNAAPAAPTQSSQYLVTPPPNAAPPAPTLSSQYLVTPPPNAAPAAPHRVLTISCNTTPHCGPSCPTHSPHNILTPSLQVSTEDKTKDDEKLKKRAARFVSDVSTRPLELVRSKIRRFLKLIELPNSRAMPIHFFYLSF